MATADEAAERFRAALLDGSAAQIAEAHARVQHSLLVVADDADDALLLAREELGPLLSGARQLVLAVGALERVRAEVLAPGGAVHGVLLGCSVDITECAAIQDAARIVRHLHRSLAQRLAREANATARAFVDRVVDRGTWPQAWLAGAATALDADCCALVAALHLRKSFAPPPRRGAPAGAQEDAQEDASLMCNALLLLRSLVRRSEPDAARVVARRLHAAARATHPVFEASLCAQLDEVERGVAIWLAQRDLLRFCTGEGSPFLRSEGGAGSTAEAAAASAAAALRGALDVQSAATRARAQRCATGTTRGAPAPDGTALALLRTTVAAAQNEVELYIAMLDEDWPNARRWLARFEDLRRQSAAKARNAASAESPPRPPAAVPRWLAKAKVDLLLYSCLEPVSSILCTVIFYANLADSLTRSP